MSTQQGFRIAMEGTVTATCLHYSCFHMEVFTAVVLTLLPHGILDLYKIICLSVCKSPGQKEAGTDPLDNTG